MYVVCFSKIFSDKNTNTKPYQTHDSNNKIFQHFNPNVITKWFIVVGDDNNRFLWLIDIVLLIFIPVRKEKKVLEPVKAFILLKHSQISWTLTWTVKYLSNSGDISKNRSHWISNNSLYIVAL